jgi:hypothetical protein
MVSGSPRIAATIRLRSARGASGAGLPTLEEGATQPVTKVSKSNTVAQGPVAPGRECNGSRARLRLNPESTGYSL